MADPQPGDLWRYDYLWQWQAMRGESEGRKARPVTFVTTIRGQNGVTHLFILPVTSKSPSPDRLSLPIPTLERRRAGLRQDTPLWLLLDEYNQDILEQSYYFDPTAKIGTFSPSFRGQILKAFKAALIAKVAKQVPRHL